MLSDEIKNGYARLIYAEYGLRLSPHQLSQLDAVVARKVIADGETNAAALLRKMASANGADLLQELAAQFTIGETYFFRVEPQIEALRHTVLPDLIARNASRRRLRLWSAGCSTGEEPYTLAMLLREQYSGLEGWEINIVASDLSHAALGAAREASYGDWSFRGTPDEIRQRYFQLDGRRWQLRSSVRDMVTFRPLNLAANTFPDWASGHSFDLILCRNVTIYFGPDVTARLYRHLTTALSPGGWVVLGPSDPPADSLSGLAPVSLRDTIMWRQPSDIPSHAASPWNYSAALQDRQPGQPIPIADHADRKRARSDPSLVRGTGPISPRHTPKKPTDAHMALPSSSTDRRASDQLDPLVAADSSLGPGRHLQLGLDHLEAGRIDLAVSCLRRATFLRSEHSVSQFALGRAFLLRGDTARAGPALLHAGRLLTGQPNDDIVPDSQGLRTGELRQAVAALLAIVEQARKGAHRT